MFLTPKYSCTSGLTCYSISLSHYSFSAEDIFGWAPGGPRTVAVLSEFSIFFMTTGKRKTNMSVHITSVLFLKAPLAFAPLCYRYLTDYLFLSVCLSFSFYFICVSGLWAAMTKSYEFNWQKHLPEYMQEGRLFDRFDEVKIAHFSDVYEVPTILMKI